MVKVQCLICGSTGYTASPDHIVCKCGGRFKQIADDSSSQGVSLDSDILRLFDFSDLINHDHTLFN